MTISAARAALPEIVERVLAGDEVTITRHGVPVVVIVRPDALRSRRASEAMAMAAEIRAAFDRGRPSRHGGRTGLTPERADQLVAELRADRDRD